MLAIRRTIFRRRVFNAIRPHEPLILRSFSVQKSPEHEKDKVEVPAPSPPSGSIATRALRAGTAGYHVVKDVVMNPRATWATIKKEIHHYWIGSKLLWSEMKVAKDILSRVVTGHAMTRRERMQLLRTTTDIFRLVPFAIFVIVPFMELLLPFALKLFPNMLPSTFQDNLKKEESLKKELQMRLAVAKFMQETLQTMAHTKSNDDKETSSGAQEVIDFIEKARLGEPLPNDTVIRIARHFKDELTLANIARPQLVSMCKYMSLQPYGADAFLRFQLRSKFKNIKEDDRRILWEGIDSLNTLELRDACSDRGMRSYGLTHFHLKKQLDEWLGLSIQKNIPISLLIMSRAFMLTSNTDDAEQILKSSMSSLDSDTINEVVVASASPHEKDTADMRLRKLESIQFQKDMIDEEREEHEDAVEAVKERADVLKGKSTLEKKSAAAAIPAQSVSATATTATTTKAAAVKEKPMNAEEFVDPTPREVMPHSEPDNTLSVHVEPKKSVVEAVSDKKKELTLYEMQAIGDLARGSSVMREKSELAVLQANVESLLPQPEPATPLHKLVNKDDGVSVPNADLLKAVVDAKLGATVTPLKAEKAAAVDDKSVKRMQSAVSTMLDTLKNKIDFTEKALGDKLNLLDKDGDGELSSDELKEAIVKILKRSSSQQEAEELVALLDSDKDGRVSLAELLAHIQKKAESFEVEALEAHVNTTAADIAKEMLDKDKK